MYLWRFCRDHIGMEARYFARLEESIMRLMERHLAATRKAMENLKASLAML